MRQKASAMMFIELMFWKNASVAESVRDEYNWRVSWCCSAAMVRQTTCLCLDNLSMLSPSGGQHLLQGLCCVAAAPIDCAPDLEGCCTWQTYTVHDHDIA